MLRDSRGDVKVMWKRTHIRCNAAFAVSPVAKKTPSATFFESHFSDNTE